MTDPVPAGKQRKAEMAQQNLNRALVHLPDAQICGVWPDGSTLRGEHIKNLIGELLAALPAAQTEPEVPEIIQRLRDEQASQVIASGETRPEPPAAEPLLASPDDILLGAAVMLEDFRGFLMGSDESYPTDPGIAADALRQLATQSRAAVHAQEGRQRRIDNLWAAGASEEMAEAAVDANDAASREDQTRHE